MSRNGRLGRTLLLLATVLSCVTDVVRTLTGVGISARQASSTEEARFRLLYHPLPT